MIELVAVRKAYRGVRGEVEVLSGVDMAAEPGEVLLISGASGAGKSTLLALLHARLFTDSGTVRLFGHDVTRLRSSSLPLLRQKMALIPQEILLLPRSDVTDNLAVAGRAAGMSRSLLRTRVGEALAIVGLEWAASVPVTELSTGERRRVALARALVNHPALLLADEPASDLDPNRRDELCGLLEELRSRGVTSVVTTNDPQLFEAGTLCGWRTLELRGGLIHPTVATERPSTEGEHVAVEASHRKPVALAAVASGEC